MAVHPEHAKAPAADVLEMVGLAARGEVVEFDLILPRGYLSALEHLADERGVTVGRLLRLTIEDYLTRERWASLSGSPG